jgi:photosystem II stability/assembly factor-like uncharacterized protein
MRALFIVVLGFVSLSSAVAQQVPADLFHELHWRGIGPYRGGRTKAVSGVPSQPNVFYIGVSNGGVWKTDDYGRTWTPIFNQEPTGSIGAVAVAPSDHNVVYAGSGEGLHRPDLSVGDGMYKSTDAGKTWTHLGLRDGQQIANIAIDPRDPNKVLVAVAGHPYGPNPERGIFLSSDGGQTWEKVLYKDENVGGSDVLFDPSNPEIAYASLWEAREGPWENGSWSGTGGGIYKSTDGGKTWKELTGGLPQGIVQANLAIAQSDPNHLIATVAVSDGIKLFGSKDGGASWSSVTDDPRALVRIGGGGEVPVPRFDPKNPSTIYIASIVTWKSTDGGKTWTGFRGAPGGDDYQNVWINPNNPEVIILTSDQGAIVTVNGGQSWSSWYNQNTAQLYHVSADNAFPYRLCGGQQESGSVCINSRGNDGEITIRDWHPVAAEEYGYVAPDPLDPDIVYGGKLTRYDRRTGQAQNVAPKPLRGRDFRVLRTEPVVFSPVDPHVLYFASNTLWKTSNGGKQWQKISPDLTRKSYALPATIGKYSSEKTAQPIQRGVIYAVAPSPLDINRIWAGTDDGLIHLTTDGGAHWSDVTPKELVPFAKVSLIDASHFDTRTAYAAINTIRLDDLRPHLYRTHDGGRTWTEINNGIPTNENTNAIREDPKRKGLLYASTETSVYVSFDDGDRWQSLRLNMPGSSVRDIIIKGDDLVAATHGRGFWILDDITPLRQVNENVLSGDHLFKPEDAVRVRWSMNTDTPLPPDFPAGPNPPDGAVLNYYLKSAASGPVTIEIKDANGNVVRQYSSTDPVPPPDPMLNIPTYWVRPPQVVETSAGLHRFLWDMRLQPIPGIPPDYPISAVPHNTAPSATSPWAMPGSYTVVLTANGKGYSQPLKVNMDPRVKTPTTDLQEQYRLSKQVYDDAMKLSTEINKANELRAQLKDRKEHAQGATAEAIDAFSKKLDEVAGEGGRRRGRGAAPGESLGSVRGQLLMVMGILQDADVAPTTQTVAAISEVQKKVPGSLQTWQTFQKQDLAAFNQQLKSAGLQEVKVQ